MSRTEQQDKYVSDLLDGFFRDKEVSSWDSCLLMIGIGHGEQWCHLLLSDGDEKIHAEGLFHAL